MVTTERIFWVILLVWFILRATLLGCQYFGNTDAEAYAETLKFFSAEDISASREYSLTGFWFKAVWGTIYIVILVLMLRFGVFAKLWQLVTRWVGEGILKRDLLFTFLFLLILQLLSFPSSFYFGYMRETASGFSNLDMAGWFLRYFKAVGLNIAFECFIFVVLIAVLKYIPSKWPWVLPLVLGTIGAGAMILTPIIVTPLFYNEKPLEAGEFKDKLLDIAQKAELSVEEIYVIDESRYSKHTNAYFTGFGKFKRIVLYDNLINSHTPDEAALIFAHEAGHWKHNHMFWGMCCWILGAFAACYAVYWLFGTLTSVEWFGLSEIHSASALPFFMLAYMVAQLLFAPIESQISQYMETQADKTSIELTGLNQVFVDAQIRLSKDNKSDLLPHPFRVFWLYSHPTAIQRIKLADLNMLFQDPLL